MPAFAPVVQLIAQRLALTELIGAAERNSAARSALCAAMVARARADVCAPKRLPGKCIDNANHVRDEGGIAAAEEVLAPSNLSFGGAIMNTRAYECSQGRAGAALHGRCHGLSPSRRDGPWKLKESGSN